MWFDICSTPFDAEKRFQDSRRSIEAIGEGGQFNTLKTGSRQNNREAGKRGDRNESPHAHSVHRKGLRLTARRRKGSCRSAIICPLPLESFKKVQDVALAAKAHWDAINASHAIATQALNSALALSLFGLAPRFRSGLDCPLRLYVV